MAKAYKIRKLGSTSVHLHQIAIIFESRQSRSLTSPERQKVVKRLALILMQAAGIATEDGAHER
jgi:hypothetical protein